jgi:hypothetical protein
LADIVEKGFLGRRSKIFGLQTRFPCKDVGALSRDDKFADDLGKAIEGTRISGRRSDFLQQENWRRAIWDFCNNICQELTSRFFASSQGRGSLTIRSEGLVLLFTNSIRRSL